MSCAHRSSRRRTRALRCRGRRRLASDITAPVRPIAPPAWLCRSRHRRRRASAEPRASRRADRAPPASPCVRRSRRRHTRSALSCRVRRVSSDITAPLALHRRLGSVRADTGTPASERRAASESSCRPSAADFVVRAPIAPSPAAARRSVRAAPLCRADFAAPQRAPPARLCQSRHARPRERRRAASESSFLIAPPASPSVRRSSFAPGACSRSRRAERADAPLRRAQLAAAPHVTAPAQFRANTTSARAPPSRERVVVPDRAAGFAERASIVIRASRVQPQPPRRARRRPPPSSSACCCSSRHRAGSI